MEITEKRTWDYDECAKQVGISRRTLSRYVKEGKIPHIHVGKRILFRPEAIEQWLAEVEQKPKYKR